MTAAHASNGEHPRGPLASRLTPAALRVVIVFGGLGALLFGAQLFGTVNRPEAVFGGLMAAIALIVVLGRAMGALLARLGQPRVMGEVLVGILLGPTLLGALLAGAEGGALAPGSALPSLLVELFHPLRSGLTGEALAEVLEDRAHFLEELRFGLSGVADIGLAFYMFLVGLELDPRMLAGRVRQAAAISGSSVALPFALGAVAALLFIPPALAPAGVGLPFIIFIGVAMSITAFPVLARILVERRMLRHPVGALALASAAIDDVLAWALLALASAIVLQGGIGLGTFAVLVLAGGLSALVLLVARPLLARLAAAYEEVGNIPSGWVVTIFLSVVVISFMAQQVGVAAIFGAFIAGLAMPRRADLTHDISRRIEEFVVVLLLPVFFVVAGGKVDLSAIAGAPSLWPLALILLAVAVIGKWLGAMIAARVGGLGWRQATAVGALMNTRGLTELIVLNIGFDLGVIGPELFAILVVMALVTTFTTGPALALIDRRREMIARPEDELAHAAPSTAPVRPERAVLVAPQSAANLPGLLAVAEPLARSVPARELILARLIAPSPLRTGLATAEYDLVQTARQVNGVRDSLLARGAAARAVAFTSADVGEDLVALAKSEQVDIVFVDGRRPIIGEGIPTGTVGHVLQQAACDVAVLIERADAPRIGPDRPVVVPFGGGDHDWSALELSAWIASAYGAPLRLLGTRGTTPGGRDASRLLASTSLVVQQLAGVAVEPLLVERGPEGAIAASEAAGLMVIGLSERWRSEGLGDVRAAIAQAALAPILFVRRGQRPGALSASSDATQFRWSVVSTPGGAGVGVSQAPPTDPPSRSEHDATMDE